MPNRDLEWVRSILGYAQLISHDRAIFLTWIRERKDITSVYYPGELFCQLFDGLSLGENIIGLDTSLDGKFVNLLKRFLSAVLLLEEWVNDQTPYPSNEQTLMSKQWWHLQTVSGALVKGGVQIGLEGDFIDPSAAAIF